MNSQNPNLQPNDLESADKNSNIYNKNESAKWKVRYFLSIPIGFFIPAALLYYYLIYSVEDFSDEAGIVTQVWIYSSIILTPVFALIIFTLLNIIKNRGFTKNIVITWAIIIFFSALIIFLIWFQANYLNK